MTRPWNRLDCSEALREIVADAGKLSNRIDDLFHRADPALSARLEKYQHLGTHEFYRLSIDARLAADRFEAEHWASVEPAASVGEPPAVTSGPGHRRPICPVCKGVPEQCEHPPMPGVSATLESIGEQP